MTGKIPVRKSHRISRWFMLCGTLVVLGGAVAANLYLEHERTGKREEERLLTQGGVIQKNIASNLSSVNLVLTSLRQERSRTSRDRSIDQRLKNLTDAMPGVRTLFIMGAAGTIEASNRPELLGRNFRQREYFTAPHDRPDPDMLYISPPFKTSLGSFTINVSRMIPGPHGEFAGIVTAGLDPEYFATLLSSVLYAPDMWSAIAHGDGIQFLMVPEREGQPGKNLAQPGSFFTRHRDSGRNSTVMTGIVYATGEKSMMAQCTIQPAELKMDKALVVAVNRNLEMIYAAWHHDVLVQGLLFGLIVLVAVPGLYVYQLRQRDFEHHAAESAATLKESADRLTLATSAANIGVWELELASHQVTWNDPMYVMYDLPRETALTHETWLKCVHPDDLETVESKLHTSTRLGVPLDDQFRIVRADGTVRHIRAKAELYCGEQNKPVRVIGVCFDVTEQREAEHRLVEAMRQAESASSAKSQFLANMSHEIRTPLNGVIGMAHLLGMTELTEEQREYVGALKVSGNNLMSLINDILDLSKIEAGKIKLEPAEFSLLHCINNVVMTQKSTIRAKGLSLNVDLDEGIPHVLVGEQLRLKQIILNLLGNAVKFTAEGSISISAELLERHDSSVLVQIAVRDTGIGIAAEAVNEIFMPFVQADGSTTRKFGGTGLGLTICRRLTELMGGSISVESTPGVGSCFKVILPFSIIRKGRPADDAHRHVPDNRDAPPLRILFAEDNPVNITFGMALLKKLGHDAVPVVNGKECLAMLAEGAFDLVLMDIQMPVMNGEEALREIRRNELGTTRRQPVIALTAYALRGEKERFLEEGFDGYVSKPLDISELGSEMKRVTGT